MSPSGSPEMSIAGRDPGYHVGIPDGWKATAGNQRLPSLDEYIRDGNQLLDEYGTLPLESFDWNLTLYNELAKAATSSAPIVTPNMSLGVASQTPPKLIMNVGDLIEEWGEIASREWQKTDKAEASLRMEDKSQTWSRKAVETRLRKQEMASVLQSLKQMSEDVEANYPIHVFGLDFRAMGKDRIRAMASVQLLSGRDGDGTSSNRDNSFGVIHINALIGHGDGIGVVGSPEREMLIQICEWAKQLGKLVSVATPTDELYRIYTKELGFEFMATRHGGSIVYKGNDHREGEPPAKGVLVDLIDGGALEDLGELEDLMDGGAMIDGT